jgi:proteasome lid subunit RPN8/RPN11
MSVHRRTPLPTGPSRGKLLVAASVPGPTLAALRTSTGPDGPHEGLAFWLGRTLDNATLVTTVARPVLDSGYGHVFVTAERVGAIARQARALGLGIVAQVHSHPGRDTRHSDGDDRLVLMPFEGMFSLVVADYGQGGLHSDQGAGLHQYQESRWVKVNDDPLVILPDLVGETS